jgi:flavin-dependent dehydrogenase
MTNSICTLLSLATLFPFSVPVRMQITPYERALKESWIGKELFAVRNTHAAFHYGTLAGMVHTALSW